MIPFPRFNVQAAAALDGLRTLPRRLGASLAQAIDLQNEYTVGHIQSKRLSRRGKETLGVVTNRLRSSVRPSRAVVTGNKVRSAIGSNVRYAATHEFGFVGAVEVRAHVRRKPTKDLVQVRNAVFQRSFAERIGERPGQQVASAVEFVSAHKRNLRVPARAPFRRGIEDRREKYAAALSAAIVNAF